MKILVTHASAGAGHMKAAEAITDGIKAHSDHDVVILDALDYTSPLFKKLYRNTYTFLITKIPAVWGFVFGLLDFKFLQSHVRMFRRIYNGINTQKFHQYLVKEQFDVVISAHFMPTEITAALKRAGRITSRLITVVTDYDVHKIWLAQGVDMYCVATEWTQEKLLSLGVEQERIEVTGIPTNEKFGRHPDINVLKQHLGLEVDAFTVLMATGSFGIGPIELIVEHLQEVQVVVVCGHNKVLFQRLSKKVNRHHKVLGLVDNMHELMAAADIMVTKPGGLSISEALVSQLPMIFFSVIPGQETGNVRVLKEYGVGISGLNVQEIARELKALIKSKDRFMTMVKKTQALARPNAVKDIVNLL